MLMGGAVVPVTLTQAGASGVLTQTLTVGTWTGTVQSRSGSGDRFTKLLRVGQIEPAGPGLYVNEHLVYVIAHCSPECRRSTVYVLGKPDGDVRQVWKREESGIAEIAPTKSLAFAIGGVRYDWRGETYAREAFRPEMEGRARLTADAGAWLSSGRQGTIEIVPLGAAFEDVTAIRESFVGGDTVLINRLNQSGRAIPVPAGTLVQVVDIRLSGFLGLGQSAYLVRVLEGTYVGRAGWIAGESLTGP